MNKTVVINVVGLSKRLIGVHTPFISNFTDGGTLAAIRPVLPALTCPAQATYLTGKWPADHGIVGNGWYFKEECEVKFWKQSNKLVRAEKLWEKLKREHEGFRCANLFWWYNMYSAADYSVTPRPNYLADGRKIPDIYTFPAPLRDALQRELGTFPLFHFWGPATSIKSSRWIAEAAIRTDTWFDPTLTLVYLPHLDYNLQRHGNEIDRIAGDLREIDAVVRQLADHFSDRGAAIILLSEYGITPVSRPVHINRELRRKGFVQVRTERGLELMDAGASRAFAVADHQIAHIYLNDPSTEGEVRRILENLPGVEQVLAGNTLQKAKLQHERSGDLVAIADRDSWFTYYYWEDDRKAPDFARTVDIHRKPGYDPVEMLTDPTDPFSTGRIMWKLFKKKLGFRTLMDVIPLKAELIRGSHGRIPEETADYPVFISRNTELLRKDILGADEVCGLIEDHILK